jgi:hypothetical protein
MEYLGSLFLVLALFVGVALFIGRPFFQKNLVGTGEGQDQEAASSQEHRLSAYLAERDRVLTALQELEFDYTLGKIPAEDYPEQRAELLKRGSNILRELDRMQAVDKYEMSAEDRIEAAVAVRRADAAQQGSVEQTKAQPAVPGLAAPEMAAVGLADKPAAAKDSIEDMIASRRRQRQEKTSGFCPKCGRPVLKSDKFCSKCGAIL